MYDQNFLSTCWNSFCAVVNSYIKQQTGGTGPINLSPLTLQHQGQTCNVLELFNDGSCSVQRNGMTETIQLTDAELITLYQSLFLPLGLTVTFPAQAARP